MSSRPASASSSDLHPGRAHRLGGALLVLAALALAAQPVEAKVFHTRQEAIALAFPDADRVEKKTTILSPEQAAAIEGMSRTKLASKLVTIFTAWRGEELLGYANVDVHDVRTHAAALMVVLKPDGEVRSVRVLAFHEPLDYLPAEKWYAQFQGKTRADRLRVGSDVHAVVNATLSTRAASDGIRRVLAYHAVLIDGGD